MNKLFLNNRSPLSKLVSILLSKNAPRASFLYCSEVRQPVVLLKVYLFLLSPIPFQDQPQSIHE